MDDLGPEALAIVFGALMAGGAVKGVIHNVGGALQSAGERLQTGLDRPAGWVGVKWSPFRIVHDPIAAAVSVAENGFTGAVESVETIADGITSGLDRVPDAFNAPAVPDLSQPGFSLRDRRR